VGGLDTCRRVIRETSDLRRRGAQRRGTTGNGGKAGTIAMPEQTVILLKTTRRILSSAIALLTLLASCGIPHRQRRFLLNNQRQANPKVVDELIRRRVLPRNDSPAVCVLDTGVNRGHLLLSDILAESDHDTVREEWGKDDHHERGHGTPMAGLAAYGDLTDVLNVTDLIELKYRLESVKILPRVGITNRSIMVRSRSKRWLLLK